MGGGTELVLSMDERLVSKSPQTKIMCCPEVKVGLPAWGGTQRLPRLIGVHAAVEMICSGEPIDAAKAVALGFAFDAVPAEKLVEEGERLLDYLVESGEWITRRKQREQPVGLTDDQAMFLFAAAEGFVKGKTKGQYPAPLAALKAIREGCNKSLEDGLKAEAEVLEDCRLADLGQLDRRLSSCRRTARTRPGRDGPIGEAARCQTHRRPGRRPDGRGYRHGERPLRNPDGHGRRR